jgi:hypothetical protein
MAKITVWNSVGNTETVIETEARTWGELQRELDERGIVHRDMRAIIGENENTLESPDAVLPRGIEVNGAITDDFTLFLSPRKVKAGGTYDGYSYREVRAVIKDAIAADGDRARTHFGNYTNLSTEACINLANSYAKKAKKTTAPKAVVSSPASAETPQELFEVIRGALTKLEAMNLGQSKPMVDLKARAAELAAKFEG